MCTRKTRTRDGCADPSRRSHAEERKARPNRPAAHHSTRGASNPRLNQTALSRSRGRGPHSLSATCKAQSGTITDKTQRACTTEVCLLCEPRGLITRTFKTRRAECATKRPMILKGPETGLRRTKCHLTVRLSEEQDEEVDVRDVHHEACSSEMSVTVPLEGGAASPLAKPVRASHPERIGPALLQSS